MPDDAVANPSGKLNAGAMVGSGVGALIGAGALPGAETSGAGAAAGAAAAASVGGKLLLDVPLVAQDKPYTCWYAAACMVSFYFRAGPRLGVPSIWRHGRTAGIMPAEFVKLAKNEGLTEQPIVKYHAPHGAPYPAFVLRQILDLGPIWCAGQWFGVGHIIVLTGIDGSTVYFNDPDGGKRKTNTVHWFNQKVDKHIHGHMMCKDPNRS